MTRAALSVDWLSLRTGYSPSGDWRAIESVGRTGRVLGMVVLDRWTPAACHAHIALDVPMACVRLFRDVAVYVFQQTGRLLIRGEIRASNTPSLSLARGAGFVEVGRVRHGWAPDEDMVQLEMRSGDCRWLVRQS